MSPIVTRPEESAVLRALLALVPHLGAKLADPDAWRGLSVHEPDGRAPYRRLVCRQELVSRTSPPRCYLVGLHAFDRDHHGALHNHRYPIAVLPLDPAGRLDEELHAMPWTLCVAGRFLASGSMTVRSGRAWAIDRNLEVYHAVHSHRDYLSVNLSDITAAPGRENRLRIEPLAESQADEVRLVIAEALERLFSSTRCPSRAESSATATGS